MKKNKKILLVTTLVIGVGIGIFAMTDHNLLPAKEPVIDESALLPAVKVINDSTRAEATAKLYLASAESEYIDENGNVQSSKVDESLIEETQIENYKMPETAKGQSEPEMTKLLQNLFSRTDGSTNEVKDETMRIVEEETFLQWESLFAKWVSGEMDEKEFEEKWVAIEELSSSFGLSKPTVLTYSFPYSKSATEMMDGVLKEIEEKGGSTAPHIAFVDVFFDKEALLYTLYFAESHVE